MNTADLRLAPKVVKIPHVEDIFVGILNPDQKYDGKSEGSLKGANTWNWVCPATLPKGDGRIMYARRFRGMTVGGHFHPSCPNKDPEQFMFLSGKVTFWFEDLWGERREELLLVNPETDDPVLVVIPPYVLHGMVIESPMACFLEQQQTPCRMEECYSPAEFQFFKKMYGAN